MRIHIDILNLVKLGSQIRWRDYLTISLRAEIVYCVTPEELMSISDHLRFDGGVWLPIANEAREVSYPEMGNSDFFLIEDGSYWFQHRNAVILDTFLRFSKPRWVLDIGGGNGVVSSNLQKNGFSVVVLEPGAEGAGNARARGIQNVINASFNEVYLRPGRVPAIGLFDVVEHIDDDLGFLIQINACLESKGRVYLTVPAYQFLWSDADLSAGHYRRYNRTSLCKLLG